MQATRRRFLAGIGSTALLTALPIPGFSLRVSAAENSSPALENLPPPSPEVHVLKRISFGIRAADLQRVHDLGISAYIDEQLDWRSLDDSDLELELSRRYSTLAMSPCELAKLEDPNLAVSELTQAYFLRGLYSRRQLYETMVDFWTDHFNVDIRKSFGTVLKSLDEREVIRPHALGYFRDLLHASARSPAMLVYLDNWLNVANGPNQNYARELMELHTLGVNGGYTEEDVDQVARCFSGWTLRGGSEDEACAVSMRGAFVFRPELHADEAKRVLGVDFPAGQGMADGERVLDLLVDHPSTARFIATKLARRFVSDVPPPGLVERVAQAWGQGGDIRAMLRVLLNSDEFMAGADRKYQRPWQAAAALLRALDVPYPEVGGLVELYFRMLRQGQVPYAWPAPDGYPDEATYWLSANGILERWKFAYDAATFYADRLAPLLAGETSAAGMVDAFSANLLHRPLADEHRSALIDAAIRHFGADATDTALPPAAAVQLAAALFASSYFQLR